VAEREAAAGLVTKVGEPAVVETKGAKPKAAAKVKKAAPKAKAKESKAEAKAPAGKKAKKKS
jgi:hypothetical protein